MNKKNFTDALIESYEKNDYLKESSAPPDFAQVDDRASLGTFYKIVKNAFNNTSNYSVKLTSSEMLLTLKALGLFDKETALKYKVLLKLDKYSYDSHALAKLFKSEIKSIYHIFKRKVHSDIDENLFSQCFSEYLAANGLDDAIKKINEVIYQRFELTSNGYVILKTTADDLAEAAAKDQKRFNNNYADYVENIDDLADKIRNLYKQPINRLSNKDLIAAFYGVRSWAGHGYGGRLELANILYNYYKKHQDDILSNLLRSIKPIYRYV